MSLVCLSVIIFFFLIAGLVIANIWSLIHGDGFTHIADTLVAVAGLTISIVAADDIERHWLN